MSNTDLTPVNKNRQLQQSNAGVLEVEFVEDKVEAHKKLLNKANKQLDEIDKYTHKYFLIDQKLRNIQQYEINKQIQLQQEQQQYLNYIHSRQNELLYTINFTGTCLWQNNENKLFYYRANIYGKETKGNKKQISKVISKNLNRDILIVDDIAEISRNNTIGYMPIYIFSTNIQMVQDDVFYPNLYSRTNTNIKFDIDPAFFTYDNTQYRNLFKPTKYLMPEFESLKNTNGSVIQKFIHYVVNKDKYISGYIMNWLAHFFQELDKSSVALVLIGDKEVTEDIFLHKIIKPIFGSKYCITIDDNMLETKSINEIVEHKIFYHIGELSTEIANKKKIKELVRDILIYKTIEAEQKSENKNTKTYIYGQTLITSDAPYNFIKDSYSQCVVFEVNYLKEILSNLRLLDPTSLYKEIQNDLLNFSKILAEYPVNSEKITYVFDTKKKKELRKTEGEKIQDFIDAIKSKNMPYFEKIKYEDNKLYKELEKDFDRDMIKQPNINLYFNILYKENRFPENRNLIEKLKEMEPDIFQKTASHSGAKYYEL